MKKYISYLDRISVSSELHERTMNQLSQTPAPLYKKRIVYRFTGLAACLIIALFCFFTLPFITKKPTLNVPNHPDNTSEIDTSLIGLPVNNFSLADMQMDALMDRMVYSKLSDFFSFSAPHLFAFVRVIGTEPLEEKDPGYGSGSVLRQKSSLYILSNLWSRDDDIPEIISLSQSLYGGCVGSETTNLLRKDGVYLLPLGYWEDVDMWYVMGDLDVLFEVDDQGFVWTHSNYEDFKRFDGENASVLADTITSFTSDGNFLSATTSFGQIAWHWGVLVDTTLRSVEQTTDQWGYERYEYILNANRVLSLSSNPWYTWQAKNGDQITAISYDSGYIEEGGRYLIFLDPSEDGPYIEPGRVARIDEDGTITAISLVDGDNTNVFDEFNGFTVEQMAEEAERAKIWHENYAK